MVWERLRDFLYICFMEIWKEIKGYSDYQVSNYGNVKSKIRTLKQSINEDGYLTVGFKKNKFLVHRLVAIAFISTNDYSLTVNHEDGNKLNNNSTNLTWKTILENIEHAKQNNLVARGESVSTNVLTEKQVIQIKNEYIPRKVSMQYLAKKYSVSKATICHIITGRNWKHI